MPRSISSFCGSPYLGTLARRNETRMGIVQGTEYKERYGVLRIRTPERYN